MSHEANPLIDDRELEFLLYRVHRAHELCALPAFAEHSRETFELWLKTTRRLAREVLWPAYRPMDAEPPVVRDGAVALHPLMKALYPRFVELGLFSVSRPFSVGGQQLPLTVATLSQALLAGSNPAALGIVGLTSAAAHLLEAFGSEELKATYMTKLYAGEWTGTMALTEPHAGSSLSDVATVAAPDAGGFYRLRGSKIFISGAEHDLTPNIVHLTLARIEGAPPGIKGVSLFAVPKLRPEGQGYARNDVHAVGAVHKIGWRGLPSLVLQYGEQNDCHGWLVGEPHKGIAYMFQMMNEERIAVGVSAAGTASAAYHEALRYARERPQGRTPGNRDPRSPQVPLVEHADVRRMLLRQKAIAEGALSLSLATARYADLAEHAVEPEERARAHLLLELLTPVAKSFPAERGFEATALCVQVHGGYGYSSEYVPELLLRDQKLNSLHEGTTGIQSLDLLGRKVMARGGEGLRALLDEWQRASDEARGEGVNPAWCAQLVEGGEALGALTLELGAKGLAGEVEAMLAHSADYLELVSVLVVAWQWLLAATAVERARREEGAALAYLEGKSRAAQYWFATEVTRVPQLVALCRGGDDSYAAMRDECF